MTVQSLNITNSCTNGNRYISGLADIFCYVSILLKLAENYNEYKKGQFWDATLHVSVKINSSQSRLLVVKTILNPHIAHAS